MARKAVSARSGRNGDATRSGVDRPDDVEVGGTLAGRVGWVVLAATWLFLAVSLGSFDASDAPSHVVAVHSETAANLCGAAGAYVAYWTYQVIGVGSWVMIAGVAGFLVVTATGRRVGHPLVRIAGLLIAAIGVSSLHSLFLPSTGPLAGSHAGLISTFVIGEFLPRFNIVGTLLLVLAILGVGAVVAVDRLVLAMPRLLWRTLSLLRDAPDATQRWLGHLLARPMTMVGLAGRGGVAAEYEYVDAAEDEDEDEYEYVDAEDEDEDEAEDEYEEDDEYEDEYEDEDADADADEEDLEEEDADETPEKSPARPILSAAQLREKIARLPVRMAGKTKTVARDEDIPRAENFKNYQFPTLDLLQDPETNFSERMESTVRKQAELLEEALNTYGIDAEVVGIESGPAVTLYSVQLAPGTKVSKVSAIAKDIARNLRTQNIRIVPNIVGKTAIGIEVPNINREKVRLKELMSGGHAKQMVLPMFLGKDASGEPLVADLTRMPHMLIAGTTGSGKSVCMNSILMSWLYTKRPDELKLVLVDPKMVEMSQFTDIPHLMCPVVTEAARAAAILEWAVERMEERYEMLREARVQNIAGYNRLSEEELYERFHAETEEEQARIPKKLYYFVFVVDELADLMMTHKEVEHSIVRIAQKARAVGIHLILATQRPQANVVTGLIKSNMPCRASFKVASGMDSRIVLDSKGAELLLGQGDMMFLTPHTSEIVRAQGTLVEDTEIRTVVKFLKSVAAPSFERSLITLRTGGSAGDGADADSSERDPLFDSAVRIMIESGRGSVSLLQRRLSVGYGRASRLVDQMSAAGIVGNHKGSVAREVLITLEDWERMRAIEEDGEHDGDDHAPDPPLIETAEDSAVPAELGGEYRM